LIAAGILRICRASVYPPRLRVSTFVFTASPIEARRGERGFKKIAVFLQITAGFAAIQ
jgi:hypothetical protein